MQELNKWLDSLGDEEVESTFTANQARSEEPLKAIFDYGIYLSDFTKPEIQIDSNVGMQTCDSSSITCKIHHNSSDIEMSTNDELVTNQLPPKVPFDYRMNSDMSLGKSREQAMEVESTLECPQSIPRQVCVLFIEASATAAMRRPTEFPCMVTMPDGVRQLVITTKMAEKEDKAITECTMMPPSSTLEEMLTFNYFNWQESMHLKHDRVVLEERKKKASALSQTRRELSINSTINMGSRYRSRLSGLPESQVEALTRNLGTS